MPINITNVNNPFPKNFYPLPSIDQLVDAMEGYDIMSFIDAYLGYIRYT